MNTNRLAEEIESFYEAIEAEQKALEQMEKDLRNNPRELIDRIIKDYEEAGYPYTELEEVGDVVHVRAEWDTKELDIYLKFKGEEKGLYRVYEYNEGPSRDCPGDYDANIERL